MNRDELEKKLTRELSNVETKFLERLLRALGKPPFSPVPEQFWREYAQELNRVLSSFLPQVSVAALSEWLSRNRIGIELTDALTRATAWSRDYITKLADKIAENARKYVLTVIADAQESGFLPEDLANRLALRFGPVHAETVAVTELTNALSFSSEMLQNGLAEQGIQTVRRWLTAEDEKVCPICAPMDHTTYESGEWAQAGLDNGPPAHANCRCVVVVEMSQ